MAPVALGVTHQPVGIQGRRLAGEVPAGPAQFAQAHLELLRLRHGVGFEQVVQGAVGRQPRQAIDQFKAPMAQGAIGPEGRPAQSRFVDQVQRQARGQGRAGRFPRPSPQQVPSAQAQVLWHQQPEAQQVA